MNTYFNAVHNSDILSYIFSFIQRPSRKELSLVCKQYFHSVIQTFKEEEEDLNHIVNMPEQHIETKKNEQGTVFEMVTKNYKHLKYTGLKVTYNKYCHHVDKMVFINDKPIHRSSNIEKSSTIFNIVKGKVISGTTIDKETKKICCIQTMSELPFNDYSPKSIISNFYSKALPQYYTGRLPEDRRVYDFKYVEGKKTISHCREHDDVIYTIDIKDNRCVVFNVDKTDFTMHFNIPKADYKTTTIKELTQMFDKCISYYKRTAPSIREQYRMLSEEKLKEKCYILGLEPDIDASKEELIDYIIYC